MSFPGRFLSQLLSDDVGPPWLAPVAVRLHWHRVEPVGKGTAIDAEQASRDRVLISTSPLQLMMMMIVLKALGWCSGSSMCHMKWGLQVWIWLWLLCSWPLAVAYIFLFHCLVTIGQWTLGFIRIEHQNVYNQNSSHYCCPNFMLTLYWKLKNRYRAVQM